MLDELKIGDTVYYTDNGLTDTGKVCDIAVPGEKYRVNWDDGSDIDDVYLRSQLTLVRA